MGLSLHRIRARLHRRYGVHEHARIDGEIEIRCRGQMRVPQEFLCDLEVAGGLHDALRKGVTKLMRAHRRANLAPKSPQRRLEGAVGQGHAMATALGDPGGRGARGRTSLGLQIAAKQGPEIIGDRDAMFLSRALESNGNGLLPFIDVG